MDDFEQLLTRLEERFAELEQVEEPVRARLFELLDDVDMLHRIALARLAEGVSPDALERVAAEDDAAAWLLHAYGIGSDRKAEAETALESVRPYVESHGGTLEVLEARGGVVRIRLSGSCAGCTASDVTLRHGVEEALRDGYPRFLSLEVQEEEAPEHPPPGPTLLQLDSNLD